MTEISASERITTRIRPVPNPRATLVEEVLTTHAAICPACSREARIGLGAAATVYGGCSHFRGIRQAGDVIEVLFDSPAKSENLIGTESK